MPGLLQHAPVAAAFVVAVVALIVALMSSGPEVIRTGSGGNVADEISDIQNRDASDREWSESDESEWLQEMPLCEDLVAPGNVVRDEHADTHCRYLVSEYNEDGYETTPGITTCENGTRLITQILDSEGDEPSMHSIGVLGDDNQYSSFNSRENRDILDVCNPAQGIR